MRKSGLATILCLFCLEILATELDGLDASAPVFDVEEPSPVVPADSIDAEEILKLTRRARHKEQQRAHLQTWLDLRALAPADAGDEPTQRQISGNDIDDNIFRLKDLREISDEIDANTLVVFDLDETLFRGDETTDISSITAKTPKILYLTARSRQGAAWTQADLIRREIFANPTWLPEELRGHAINYTGQGGLRSHKGRFLLPIVQTLRAFGVPIDEVIFVDDRPSQVRSVVRKLLAHHIVCSGIIFEKYVQRDEKDHILPLEEAPSEDAEPAETLSVSTLDGLLSQDNP